MSWGDLFEKARADSERAAYIQTAFNERGIQVVWGGKCDLEYFQKEIADPGH